MRLSRLLLALAPADCTNPRSLSLGDQFFCITRGWITTILAQIPAIIIALLVLTFALWIDDRVQRAVERLVGLRNGQRELARLLGRLARIGVVLLALLFVLSVFRLDTLVTSFVASLGIVGLVVAFALQDITKNFAAGILLLIQRPFRLDDRIKVKEFEGIVTDVSLRATTLRTSDGDEVLVPNADVYTSPITNLTRYARRRYHVPLNIPATLPPEPVRQRLEAALRAIPGLEADPAPQVVITGITAENVIMDAQYWLPSGATNAPQVMTQVIDPLHRMIETWKMQVPAKAVQEDNK